MINKQINWYEKKKLESKLAIFGILLEILLNAFLK